MLHLEKKFSQLKKKRKIQIKSYLVAQWVKVPVLSLQRPGFLLWHGFDPWPGNLHLPWVQLKKKIQIKSTFKRFKEHLVLYYSSSFFWFSSNKQFLRLPCLLLLQGIVRNKYVSILYVMLVI